ncbi:hypothetical protein Drorol1_Dr00024910, partial [Drosera rotundifolia]
MPRSAHQTRKHNQPQKEGITEIAKDRGENLQSRVKERKREDLSEHLSIHKKVELPARKKGEENQPSSSTKILTANPTIKHQNRKKNQSLTPQPPPSQTHR